MSWFRFHSEVLHDPKVQKLSGELFRTWVNLLCVASKHDGELTGNRFDLSFYLRMPEPKVRVQLQHLIDAELIDQTESGWKPHNWDKWQFKSDNSTKRSQRCRQRKGDVAATSPDTDTEQKTDTDTDATRCNATRPPTPRQELEKVLDADHARAVVDHRQKLRKPLSARAAKMLAKQLGQHADPNVAADTMIMRGWAAFDPGWAAAQLASGGDGELNADGSPCEWF